MQFQLVQNYNTVDTSKVIPQFATAVQTWTVYVRSAGLRENASSSDKESR